MTPPRGIVRPAIQAALCGLLVACAAWGWLARRTRPEGVAPRCGNCPDGGCYQLRSVPPRRPPRPHLKPSSLKPGRA